MENQTDYHRNGKSQLERAHIAYRMEDPSEIGSLGISGEQYDGSEVHYVIIVKNLGELTISLINQDTIATREAWKVIRKQNQEKLAKHLGLEFLL